MIWGDMRVQSRTKKKEPKAVLTTVTARVTQRRKLERHRYRPYERERADSRQVTSNSEGDSPVLQLTAEALQDIRELVKLQHAEEATGRTQRPGSDQRAVGQHEFITPAESIGGLRDVSRQKPRAGPRLRG